MKEIGPGIFQIDTEAFGEKGLVASYLVQGREKTALIDPGFPSSFPVLSKKLEEKGLPVAALDYILLTHFHLDHSGGTGALLQKAPKAQVVVHKRGAFYVQNFGKIVGGARLVFRNEIIKKFGKAEAVPAEKIIPVEAGFTIDLGGPVKLQALGTPGHCADEVSFYEEASGALFTGDAACLQFPDLNYVPIPAASPPIFDLEEELASLNLLKKYEVKRILVPHFGEIEGPWPEYIEKNICAIGETREKLTGFFKENLEFPQMVERLRGDLLKASGKNVSEIPEFFRETYLREMLKTGLMGFLAYLLEYAPYPRAFS